MRHKIFSVVLLGASIFLMGADWPVAVKVGDPLILNADDNNVVWHILPVSWNRIVYPNTNQVAFDTSKTGVVGVVLTDAEGVLIKYQQIIVGSGEPDPNPGPTPDPEPEPNPVEFLFGMVFYESDDVDNLGPETAQVILGARLRSLDDNFQWMAIDLDVVDGSGNVPEDLKPWIDLINDKELEMPQLFLVDRDGVLRKNQKLPETVDEVITLVREVLPE